MKVSPDIAARLLGNVSIFGALTEDSIAFLMERAELVAAEHNDYFVRQGEPGDGLYVLESGHVDVLRQQETGERLQVCQLGPGECFGEIALLAMVPRTASIRAAGPARALRLSHTHVAELYGHNLEQFTVLIMNLGREVCRRLARSDEMLFRVAPHEFAQALTQELPIIDL